MMNFKGIYPALMTPLAADGGVDTAALRRLVRLNLEKGVHGFDEKELEAVVEFLV